MNIVAFEVGRTYSCRSICDHNCVWSFEIVSRTAKTVVLKHGSADFVRRRVRLWDGIEQVDPFGRFSMSPVLSAR